MGAAVRVVYYAAGAAHAAAAHARVRELDARLSDFNSASELSLLARAAPGEPREVSADLFRVLATALRISALTNGAFDVTLAPLVRLWREARRAACLPEPEQLAAARTRYGYEKLRLDPARRTVTLTAPGMSLDLGGIGKGFAAAEALAVLRRRGVARAMVAVAGDIACGAPPPGRAGWHIALEQPAAVLSMRDACVSTSGDSEQFVEIDGVRYSHILDPRTGVGLTDRTTASVAAPDGATADALATALSVMGFEAGQAFSLRHQLAARLTRPGAAWESPAFSKTRLR